MTVYTISGNNAKIHKAKCKPKESQCHNMKSKPSWILGKKHETAKRR